MTLTDEDLRRAGNAALRLLGLPEHAEITTDSFDPDFAFVRFPLPDGTPETASLGIHIGTNVVGAVLTTLDGITNDISETDAFWGVAFPRCPGHGHPAGYGIDGSDVRLRCPEDGHELARVSV